MKTSTSILRLVIVALIILALGALGGWYYFLRGSESHINALNQGTGNENPVPSFAGSTGSTNANVMTTLGESGSATVSPTARLWEVSQVPVAGFGWIASPASGSGTSTQPALYFVERSSGNVLEAETDGNVVLRLTDTLFPKIYQALISRDGSVIERSVDDSGAVVTFAGVVASSSAQSATSTSPGTLAGADLPQGIGTIADSANTETLYYTIPSSTGISVVSTNWNGTKETSLFSSSIEDWHLIAPGDGTLVLLQSPLDGQEGYAYKLQKGGGLALLAEGPGLTVLPRASSAALLFGASENGTLALFARSSASATPTELSIQTIADKCGWTPGGGLIAYCGVPQTVPSQNFLNDWYKGLVHTSDELYEVDASAASTTLFYDPSADTSEPLDIEDLSVDPSGQYIAFINGADRSLWVLRIAQ